ncbi:MAG: glycosyltransferase [Leptospirillum sp.]
MAGERLDGQTGEGGRIPERPVHVCHLFPSLPLHGAENHFLKLSRNLDPAVIRTSILVLVERGELAPDFEALGIPVTLIRKKSRYDLSVVPRVRRFLRSGAFDIIHTHLFTANFWGRLAALGLSPIVVSSAHNVVPKERPALVRVENFLDRLLSRATDAIFCVTGQVMQSMKADAGLPRHKLVTIENGLPFPDHPGCGRSSARTRLDLPEQAKVMAVIGRFSTQKNHAGFLQALEEVVKEHPETIVLFVGEGELEPSVREEVAMRNLSGHVRFLGQRRDIPEILEALDLLVVPSLWEGLPNVMLEAMAAGIPVVATSVGGIPDVLTHQKTGVMCEPTPDSLSQAMVWALSHPREMDAMARASSVLIRDRYDIRNTARRYTGFYRTLARQRRFSRGARDVARRGVGRMFSRPSLHPSGTLRVLMYHRIADDPGTDILSVTPFAFFEQMRWLKEEGYTVLPVTEAIWRLESGTLPTGSVCLTFDDGYRDNFTEAFPVLSRHGYSAMIFPVTGFVLGEGEHPRYRHSAVPVPYLSVEQIREMHAAGIEFGCHTHTHPLLSGLTENRASFEIGQAKKLLEDWTKGPVRVFAYPNGVYRPAHFSILDNLSFDAAFSVRPGTNGSGTPRWELRRTEVSGRDSLRDFMIKMRGGLDVWHGLYQSVKGFYR